MYYQISQLYDVNFSGISSHSLPYLLSSWYSLLEVVIQLTELLNDYACI